MPLTYDAEAGVALRLVAETLLDDAELHAMFAANAVPVVPVDEHMIAAATPDHECIPTALVNNALFERGNLLRRELGQEAGEISANDNLDLAAVAVRTFNFEIAAIGLRQRHRWRRRD
jgi:hypothetical protein